MEIVSDRKSKILLAIIEQVCLPGIIINLDGWAAYKTIKSELGFEHGVINHNRHFVCPKIEAYTQNSESYWNKMKGSIKQMKGIGKEQLPGLLAELIFKDAFKDSTIDELMRILRVK